MKRDSSLFGLRFGSNAALQPTQEDLRTFLVSNERGNRKDLRKNALTTYSRLLEDVLLFQRQQPQELPSQNSHDKMFFGVLSHSCLFDPALKSAVEQYLYHLQSLISLDFMKPEAFLKASEEAISKLNPKKRADAAKQVKFRDMADERRKLLVTLKNRRSALVEELGHIALYIRNNLLKIGDRCETSIVVLVDSQIARTEETRLIEDIKTYFKEKLRNDLHDGLVTKQDLEIAQKDVALLSKELSNILREYVFALTRLFETIYEHVTKNAREIDTLMDENQGNKNRSFKEDVDLFTRIERVLVELLSGAQFALTATDIKTETTHFDVLLKKRKEMLDHLFELMQKERRSRTRRHLEKRRRVGDQINREPLRRSGNDRRATDDRRKFADASL